MANLLCGIISGVLPVPTFTGTQPIQLVILLGMEKLRKDYVHVLSQTNVLEERQINEYLGMNKTIDAHGRRGIVLRDTQLVQLPELAHYMAVLGRLETLCELLCLVPDLWLPFVSAAAVQQYLGPNVEGSPVGSFGALANQRLRELCVRLPARIAEEEVKDHDPVQLSRKIVRKARGVRLANAMHMSQRPIFPPCIYASEPNTLHTTGINTTSYYYTTILEITNYFGKGT